MHRRSSGVMALKAEAVTTPSQNKSSRAQVKTTSRDQKRSERDQQHLRRRRMRERRKAEMQIQLVKSEKILKYRQRQVTAERKLSRQTPLGKEEVSVSVGRSSDSAKSEQVKSDRANRRKEKRGQRCGRHGRYSWSGKPDKKKSQSGLR